MRSLLPGNQSGLAQEGDEMPKDQWARLPRGLAPLLGMVVAIAGYALICLVFVGTVLGAAWVLWLV
jgi:hypothetical protein